MLMSQAFFPIFIQIIIFMKLLIFNTMRIGKQVSYIFKNGWFWENYIFLPID